MTSVECERTATAAPPWPLHAHLELGALTSAVPCARLHVRAIVHEWGMGHSADTAELLTSELVTNAVQASQRLGVRAAAIFPVIQTCVLSDRISLVIRVWDGDAQMPFRRESSLYEEGGRGLMLVASLATEWGAYHEANGKIVWALLDTRVKKVYQ
jgi:anti-sigma regulatory factor (Ser/Thr protein kinase)